MKKINCTLLFLATILIAFTACSGDSYEKRVKKQKKVIKNFMSDKEILYTYPADHHFEPNQYYNEPNTSIYYQVVDPGTIADSMTVDDKKKANIPVVLMFDSIFFLVSNYSLKGDYYQDGSPIRFTYGKTNTYTNSSSGTDAYTYMSQSLVLPLEKGIGTGAIVNIVVPFQNGSTYQQYYYEPFYYQELRYTYFKQESN